MKICASNAQIFANIESKIADIDKDFIKQFDTIECLVESCSSNLKLISSKYYSSKNTIFLPNNFILTAVQFTPIPQYKKQDDGKIEESVKYQLHIECKMENTYFDIYFINLMESDVTVELKRS